MKEPTRQKWRKVWEWVKHAPTWFLHFLDWAVAVGERLLVLAIFCVLFFLGRSFMTDTLTPHQRELFKTTGETWKAVLILLIPLFYLTIRMFLEQATEFWLLKRPLPRGQSEDGQAVPVKGDTAKPTGLTLEEE
jgi:hypothetical protein